MDHGSEQFRTIAERYTVLRGQVGSGLHGVTIEGQDDRDEMGVCVEPAEYVIGNSRFEQYIYRTQPEGHRSGPGDLDLVVYSLRKWARLAAAGNPTVLLLMFIPPQELVTITDVGRDIQDRPGEEALEAAAELEAQLLDETTGSGLPEFCDQTSIDAWLVRTYQDTWSNPAGRLRKNP